MLVSGRGADGERDVQRDESRGADDQVVADAPVRLQGLLDRRQQAGGRGAGALRVDRDVRLLDAAGPAQLRRRSLDAGQGAGEGRVVLGGDRAQPGAAQVERRQLAYLLDGFGFRAADGGQRVADHGGRRGRAVGLHDQVVDGLRADVAGDAAAEAVVRGEP